MHVLGSRLSRIVLVLSCLAVLSRGVASADPIDDLSRSLARDPSVKVRIVSAVSLGRLRDRRAVPALVAALRDSDATVRGVAATALGEIGDIEAAPALQGATHDPSDFVREQASKALGVMAPAAKAASGDGATFVLIKGMGNKTRLGGREYADKLRDLVIRELSQAPIITLAPGKHRGAYTLEGSITELHRQVDAEYIDVSCTVSLVIGSYPDGAIVMMTSGDATVQEPRRGFNPTHEAGMQVDAMASAVKEASQNLVAFLSSRR